MHTCRPENVIEHQLDLARVELDRFEVEVGEYLSTPSAQAHVAFARWCRENGRH